jgi:hypothetical protein
MKIFKIGYNPEPDHGLVTVEEFRRQERIKQEHRANAEKVVTGLVVVNGLARLASIGLFAYGIIDAHQHKKTPIVNKFTVGGVALFGVSTLI